MKPDDDLLLYWSNELEPEKRAAVEARLRDDSEAASYLEELEGLAQALDTLPRSPAPPALARRTIADLDRLSDAAPAEEDRKLVPLPRKPWFTHWMAIAAGVIATAILIFLYAVPQSPIAPLAEQTPPAPKPTAVDEVPVPSPATVDRHHDPTSKRSRVASRLFVKESRFSSSGRFRAARERLQKIRSQLPNHSSVNEKA